MSDLSKNIKNAANKDGELKDPVFVQKNEEKNQNSIDIPDFSFADLVDVSDLQPLINHYSELAGCVIGILDVDNTILASAGWQKICSYFHRLHPDARVRCTECDNFIKQNLNTENCIAYKCKNGLWDVIHPIYIEGKHLANIFFGQFFFDDEIIDISHFENQATKFGFDKTEYIKALHEVPVFSSKKVDTLKHFNAALAHIITKKGYANLLLKKEKIEELKIVNEQLKESELKFRKLFEQAGVGVALVGASTGRFLKINKKFADMLGYTIDEMLQLTFQHLTHPDDLKENIHHQELLLQKKITEYSTEKRYFRKDGTIIWVMITVSPMWELEDGKEYHILIVQDVSERKKIEHELIENETKFKELNSTKDKFFSIIAHDLKNPFTVLKGASELLSIYLEKNDLPKSKAKAEMISNASRNGYALLENLLVWAKSQTEGILFEPQKINFKNKVGESIKEIEDNARDKNIIIINEIPGDLILEVDENLLSVVFRNLITNAIKFTHYGGMIRITAKIEKHLVEIAVIDTGIGIPKEHQYKLFRLDTNFSRSGTANEKSTSLGLLLCKEFIEKHKGKIWVESEENKGSEFRFTLPYIQNSSVS